MSSPQNQSQQSLRFKKHLEQYWASKGISQIKIPQIGGKELNLYKLYKSVCKKGGGQAVSHNKMWKEIVDEFGLPSTCTSASFTLKNHYQKYLLGYEQKYHFGKGDDTDLPELVAGRTRKPMPGMRGMDEGPINYLNKYGDRMMDSTSLKTELSNYYEKCDPNQMVNYIKRTKMYPSMPEVKRMILGFQSRLKEEVTFSINTLLLYSVNTQAPFLFVQYPHVIDSIFAYMKHIVPPKSIVQLEELRSLLVALRNLAIDYRNLQPIQESGMAELMKQILESKVDREISRSVVDIFSSLTNIGWDCTSTIQHIENYLEKESIQDLETGIDLLKTLVFEKQQICEEIIIKKIDFFTRLLVHPELFIREAILEIFGSITDKSKTIRKVFVNNFRFMNRLFAILSYSLGHSEKQSQLAGYILSNLTKDEQNEELLQKFQKKIAVISFNDDFLSSITTSLLFKLSRPESNEQAKENAGYEEEN